MITLRRASERGASNHGWLASRHTFSFSDYHDPKHMGYRALRVINDDRVSAGQGFGTHGHRDMEIISYVLEGELAHKDSMGTGSVIKPGDIQRMSAGTGVTHSEFNPSKDNPVHFLQIWIIPEKNGIAPSYEQKTFSEQERRERLRVVASSDGRDGSVLIHQDVTMMAGLIGPKEVASYALSPNRHAWVHIAKGRASVNGNLLSEGDGAAIHGEEVRIEGVDSAEVIVFDLA